ncbi:MAG TPA: VOC family protein [Pyrinomonadaceae bacterium]|nr:VOC family protein [Pyrinomonadaceae bacterium]
MTTRTAASAYCPAAMNVAPREISTQKRSLRRRDKPKKLEKENPMRPTYQMTVRQLLTLTLLAALCGAASLRLLPDRWISAAAAAESNPQATGAKKKVNNPVVHFEIGCRDLAKTKAFYGKLFEWDIAQTGVINTGGEGIGGHITSLGHEPNNYVTVYVQVEDIQASLQKAVDLGGKVLVPAIPIPTGKFAWIADPEGNMVALLQPK